MRNARNLTPEVRRIVEAFLAQLEAIVREEVERRCLALVPRIADERRARGDGVRQEATASRRTAAPGPAASPLRQFKQCRGILVGGLTCRRRIPQVWDLC